MPTLAGYFAPDLFLLNKHFFFSFSSQQNRHHYQHHIVNCIASYHRHRIFLMCCYFFLYTFIPLNEKVRKTNSVSVVSCVCINCVQENSVAYILLHTYLLQSSQFTFTYIRSVFFHTTNWARGKRKGEPYTFFLSFLYPCCYPHHIYGGYILCSSKSFKTFTKNEFLNCFRIPVCCSIFPVPNTFSSVFHHPSVFKKRKILCCFYYNYIFFRAFLHT